jgi:hypothetical protein
MKKLYINDRAELLERNNAGKNQYKKVKFSAFVESYKMQGNLKICEKVKVVWHLPEGNFEYYKGIVDSIEMNVNE